MMIDPSVLAAFLTPEHLIIIIILYVIGIGLKKRESLKDNYIPVILTLISLALCIVVTLAFDPIPVTFQSTMQMVYNVVVQTFACVAAAVYFNQIGKQLFVKLGVSEKEETEEEKSE